MFDCELDLDADSDTCFSSTSVSRVTWNEWLINKYTSTSRSESTEGENIRRVLLAIGVVLSSGTEDAIFRNSAYTPAHAREDVSDNYAAPSQI